MGLVKPTVQSVWHCRGTGTQCGSEMWKMEAVCFCQSCDAHRNGVTDAEATIQEMNRVSRSKDKAKP